MTDQTLGLNASPRHPSLSKSLTTEVISLFIVRCHDRGYWCTQGPQHTILNPRLILPSQVKDLSSLKQGLNPVDTWFTTDSHWLLSPLAVDQRHWNKEDLIEEPRHKNISLVFYFFCKSQHSVMTFKHQSPWNRFSLILWLCERNKHLCWTKSLTSLKGLCSILDISILNENLWVKLNL